MPGNICIDSGGFGQCPKSVVFPPIVLVSGEPGKQKDNFVMRGGEGDGFVLMIAGRDVKTNTSLQSCPSSRVVIVI